ncbi:putative Drug resistance transporter Bcr/CflA subfamily [Vibrio nigripulchritudo SO65]|uniref:purine nucleoside transporter PunC n=1 Tax=Vibrio nigripulchritudo TaxID=28173 RepID=UPI0003B21980|nr:purine nucleoside transporter PunC [Vibrio nigripulchritudo]CCN33399.1 putative Drug resistance transporter Bcr/CflA subfamily [Vibrio nigripulchritudo AM115]CCN42939.1 putative Drug resistance transporter Bcr/CflA subfamily [Vibrio nigripulchritudo FTn2]CCN65419.1 putative Drug resistance transporter Bcr/CflA subfamily [Vibrio nigripulchritudo POn4]CCN79484.1 putative Drug resistance transporter Bcr/CflA subfamily [Vibrio nigripulchritudo SO65]
MKATKFQLFYLALLSMLGFIATDMYLPAFKAMEHDFATGPESIAMSLSVFLAGLAAGQFLWGLASDKYGHKRTLIFGLVIFGLSSLALASCTSIWQLQLLRFIQALGVCAPAVIWQAMVIKLYEEKVSQQIFATIMPLVALSPALAPQLGVALLNLSGWRSIFVVLAMLAIILVLITLMQVDTHSENKTTSMGKDIKSLMGSRIYLGNVMMFAMASAAFFAYLTGMPEIMAKLGYDAKDIGFSFIPQTIAFMVGGYLGKRCVAKYGDELVLKQLLALFSVSALLVFMATQWTLTTIYPLLVPFCFIAIANGALYPIVVNRALSSAKQSPATAAGLQNSLQICVSGIASAVVAAYASMALTITGFAILVCLIGLWTGYFVSHKKAARHFTLPDNSRVVAQEEK